MLERAAWRLRRGMTVTDAAWEAGYESVEGFSRAFARAYGRSPSEPDVAPASDWLPAPNGIHFHPPTNLWVHTKEHAMDAVTDQLIRYDLDDARALIEHAKGIDEAEWHAVRSPGYLIAAWEGPEETAAAVLERVVFAKEVWLAAIEGTSFPEVDKMPTAAQLLVRHDEVAGRWLSIMRDIEHRNAWDDRIVDALCDPPESFVLSGIVTHVLTYSAHRRLLARSWLHGTGIGLDEADPIIWQRQTSDRYSGRQQGHPPSGGAR